MNKKIKIDYKLLIAVLILLFVGILLVQSSSSQDSLRIKNHTYYYTQKHIAFVLTGLLILLVASVLDYKHLKTLAPILFIASIILNLLLFSPFGVNFHGQTRWLKIGPLPQFMPSELLKISSIIFLATYLDKLGHRIKESKEILKIFLIIALSVGLVGLRDLGTATVIGVSLMAMVFVSDIKRDDYLKIIILAVFVGLLLLLFFGGGYRIGRILSFFKPSPENDDYHQKNALYGVAMGGFFGSGLGQGVQKFAHIPNVFSDSIFAVAGEEFGLLGCTIIVFLYIYIVYKSFLYASQSGDFFTSFLAIGLGTSLGIQALFHILVNIGLAPVTGITLSFISYGGTSIWISLAMVGILLSISARSGKK